MLLYDKSGADVSGVVGPLEEGSALVLVCEVRGGKFYNAYKVRLLHLHTSVWLVQDSLASSMAKSWLCVCDV